MYSVLSPPDGIPTRLQRELFAALSHLMTGHDVDTTHLVPVGPIELAETLAHRNAEFRTRISQLMLLGELVLQTVPDEVCSRVDRYIAELSMPTTFVAAGRDSSTSSLAFALADFGRNGYTNDWHPDQFPLHTSTALADPWEQTTEDDELPNRWRGVADANTPPSSAPDVAGAVLRLHRGRTPSPHHARCGHTCGTGRCGWFREVDLGEGPLPGT